MGVEAMIRAINKVTAPLARRVSLMVGRGVLALVNDAAKMQGVQVQLLSGEVRDMERFQNYGLTSQPHAGAEVAAVFVGGNRNHGLVLAVDDRRYRLKGLQGGEVALSDDLGHIIKLSRTGIVITGATQDINIVDCPRVIVTGGDVIADGISLKQHHHDEHDGPATTEAKA
jgi:phage baseplate assembly protein V